MVEARGGGGVSRAEAEAEFREAGVIRGGGEALVEGGGGGTSLTAMWRVTRAIMAIICQ